MRTIANPYHHAVSSSRRFGGEWQDYIEIHEWFDASKEMHADCRHRALRHHTQGIFDAMRVFGTVITNSDGREIPVRWVGEQHVHEDLGWIPSFGDWLGCMTAEPWMNKRNPLSSKLENSKSVVVA